MSKSKHTEGISLTGGAGLFQISTALLLTCQPSVRCLTRKLVSWPRVTPLADLQKAARGVCGLVECGGYPRKVVPTSSPVPY